MDPVASPKFYRKRLGDYSLNASKQCSETKVTEPFKVLCLDGGGARGVYTLGVIEEFEKMIGQPCNSYFDLIYGTSTGAIIAALISSGNTAEEASSIYFDIIPSVFRLSSPPELSRELRKRGDDIFGEAKFDIFKTLIGIVTTDCDHERPKIFKNNKSQSFSRAASFDPGFGATVVDALMASSAAVPYFEPVRVETSNQGSPKLIDGGFVANNPTLFAITDAIGSLGRTVSDLRILNVGTGAFSAPKPSLKDQLKWRFLNGFFPAEEFLKTLSANSGSVDFLVSSLFPDLRKIRISESFPQHECGLLTYEKNTLRKIHTCGRDSFGAREKDIRFTILDK